jgi:tetratricopeptide (TPR) repeat protein
MKPAPQVALAASAANRPSIAARPRALLRAGAPLLAALSLAGAGVGAQAQTQVQSQPQAQSQSQGIGPGTSNPMGAPEPVRPVITTPYDGAIAAYRAGRSDEALALTEEALKAEPRGAQLRFLRGVILAERGRTDEALTVFRGMVEDFPELPEPYNNLAVIHAGRGEWDAARQALEQSVRAVPTYALAHENLGDIHLQLAARAYEQAGRLDPRGESARRKLALAREMLTRVQAAPPDSRNPRPGAQPPPQVTPR